MRMLSESDLVAWRAIPTAVLSDERQHHGVLSGLRLLFPDRSFAAQALTIEVQNTDNGAPRAALAQAWRGACIAIDARTRPDGAVWGGNLIALARARGVAAIVVDGNVRDMVDLRKSGLAVCSRGVTPRGPVWGGRIGGPIQCGGISIHTGDLIVGDEDGVVAVPLEAVNEELLDRCRARLADDSGGNAG